MNINRFYPQCLRYSLQSFGCRSKEKKLFRRHFSLILESDDFGVTKGCDVPNHIVKPFYADNQQQSIFSKLFKKKQNDLVKNEELVEKIRHACRVGRRVLNHLKSTVKVGISTDDLDFIGHQLICKENAYPSPLKYQSFPKSICTSVNNVVVHGIPDSRRLKCGDLINVDISVFVDGVHGDLSEMFMVGDVDEAGMRLVDVTKKCLDKAISICQPGQALNSIGKTISHIAHAHGYTVCPHFVGHGIGEEFHEKPQILHHDNSFPGNMVPGMVFTIEPVLCEGRSNILYWKDGWTVVTKDKQRAAQFEHTIHITDHGAEILTLDDPKDTYLQPDETSLDFVKELLEIRPSLKYVTK